MKQRRLSAVPGRGEKISAGSIPKAERGGYHPQHPPRGTANSQAGFLASTRCLKHVLGDAKMSNKVLF